MRLLRSLTVTSAAVLTCLTLQQPAGAQERTLGGGLLGAGIGGAVGGGRGAAAGGMIGAGAGLATERGTSSSPARSGLSGGLIGAGIGAAAGGKRGAAIGGATGAGAGLVRGSRRRR